MPALALQRKAQWRLDFVAAENSMGFHAPQETACVLAESIDYGRQGQLAARTLVHRRGRRASDCTDVSTELGDPIFDSSRSRCVRSLGAPRRRPRSLGHNRVRLLRFLCGVDLPLVRAVLAGIDQ